MNRIPNWLKWLVLALVFALIGAAVLAVDRRASRVDIPDPDNTFGIYRDADARPPLRSIKGARPKAGRLFALYFSEGAVLSRPGRRRSRR